jgi:Transglycosylase SLT domain
VVNARHASVDAIPGRALTAYQRAETVMLQADASCRLGWELVAAVGKVESNHGRFGGALMTADGVVHPAILGPQLTGAGATSRIDDTDAGSLDGDRKFDRAVGPMQFIPSTWTVVGVDADADGRRDPQDIDDASLAAAVYLCSGTDDLSTTEGQRAAVFRYNHSETYVDNVLAIMAGYLHADPGLFRVFGGSGVLDPDDYPGGGLIIPTMTPTPTKATPTFDIFTPSHSPTASPTSKPTPTAPPTTATPTATPTPTQSPTATAEPEPTSTSTPTEEPTETPTVTPTGTPAGTPTGTPTDPPDPPDPVVTQELLNAWSSCAVAGVPAADLIAMTACLVELTGLPANDPAIAFLLANPPSTPPAPTGSQQPRVRRRR